MITAILSDIHGNREAFSAVLADCAERGITRFVLTGDLVGYGPDPDWCCTRARALAAEGAVVLLGNHDHAIAAGSDGMTALARTALDWSRSQLSPENRAFLESLPLTVRLSGALLVHASAHSPQDWLYITSARDAMISFRSTAAALTICGHVHRPQLFSCDLAERVTAHEVISGVDLPLLPQRRWLVVAGAVGQPRDGDPRASWLLWDPQAALINFRRTAYDAELTAVKIREAGLPWALAERLLLGR